MNETYVLSDGFEIPKIGIGTYSLNGIDGARRIEQAIHTGYRLLDSAFNYENEGAVGRAVRNSGVPRDQLTITSKLPGRHHAYDAAVNTIQESLMRMNVEYIDLYLIHWPNPIEDKYVEAWEALIDARKAGLVRSIGVSNFLPEHIERLEKETGILPAVNQVELHPYFNQQEQLAYEQTKGIITQAWSPIGKAGNVLSDGRLNQIAETHQKSIAQVILRWHIQRDVLPIPKSGNVVRQKENIDVFDFELSDEEMQAINQLSRTDGRRKNQDPAVYQEF